MSEQTPNPQQPSATQHQTQKKKGCSPIWIIVIAVLLLVGVAMLAIVAAVALPMYARFQQKAQTSGYIQAAMQTVAPINAIYDEYGNFSGLQFDGADFTQDGNVIASLPPLENVVWEISTYTDRNEIRWTTSGTKCPEQYCSGVLCLECTDNGCNYAIKLITPALNLDKTTFHELQCSF